jgi:hypothetical protein
MCMPAVGNQGLSAHDTEIDTEKIRSEAGLIELIRRWLSLDVKMQRALLAAARAYNSETGKDAP